MYSYLYEIFNLLFNTIFLKSLKTIIQQMYIIAANEDIKRERGMYSYINLEINK